MERKAEQGAAAQGSGSEVARVLRAAKARIERGWCRGQQARTADGRYALPTEPDAAAWCMYGALRAEGCSYESAPVQFVVRAVGKSNFGDWNDAQSSVGPVLAKFDEAIALAEAAK